MKLRVCLIAFLFTTMLSAQENNPGFKPYTQNIPGTAVSFNLVPIPGGVFTMGSKTNEAGRDADEGPQTTFNISPFWMGQFEVTQDEYLSFFRDINFAINSDADAVTRPSPPYIDFSPGMGKEGKYPANSMQQYGALMYCRWLYNKTGIFFRLPTEAEWEYAAKAGSATAYFFGDDEKNLPDFAWYKKNSDGKYHEVGLLKPNQWNLYDMYGNVAEWTLDQYDANYFEQMKSEKNNPVLQPDKKHPRTIKGGSYLDNAAALRSANRIKSELKWNQRDPQIPKSKWWNTDAPFIGFRIVRPVEQPSPDAIESFFKLHLGK